MAFFRASRHYDCVDPTHFGHRSNPFRTPIQRCRKTVRI